MGTADHAGHAVRYVCVVLGMHGGRLLDEVGLLQSMEGMA